MIEEIRKGQVSAKQYQKTKKSNFRRDVKLGEIGEHYVAAKILCKPGQLCFDVSKTKEGIADDIDYLVIDKDGNKITYEIKTDFQAWKTKNIAYEISSNGNPGCMFRSKADYIIYYVVGDEKHKDVIYFIETKKFKDYIIENYLTPFGLDENSFQYLHEVINRQHNYNAFKSEIWYKSIRAIGEGAIGAIIPGKMLIENEIISNDDEKLVTLPHPEDWENEFRKPCEEVIELHNHIDEADNYTK